ncbi:SulP family inorganic anion transporter [Pollutibacter soli]|uniref:SulP family inorganic anion transporter n=1 Tax=Pollutibacter soli TaxID=3034157 RepID=UPI0030135A51
MKNLFKTVRHDVPSSIVVFLVAVPLCLGIALGSKAPLFSGIIAGIVGGIVVGLLSKSPLSVSGPAAGLTAVVVAALGKLPGFESFLLAVVLAGVFQLILGYLKAGVIGDFVPNAVIKGMLAAIGIILILKQFPHLVGYDADFAGDESFNQDNRENTFSGLAHALRAFTPAAMLIGGISFAILLLWQTPVFKKSRVLQLIPAPLVVVVLAVTLNQWFLSGFTNLGLESTHLVNLPIAEDLSAFLSFFTFPDFSSLNNYNVWTVALTIAIVASLESLLCIEAIDKLDPFKRVTPSSRELKAQGVGNIVSGLLGGIPITSVIVRSSVNLNAGARSKASAILHGTLLLVSVIFIPKILNMIPLAALAAILIHTGLKLANIKMIRNFYKQGWDQFVPFVTTVIAILFTDLLIGIVIGLLVGLFFMIQSNFKSAVLVVNNQKNYLFRFRKDVSFLNKPIVKRKLQEIPENSHVLIDTSRADFIDKDVIEAVNDFLSHAHLKNIRVELKNGNHRQVNELFKIPGAEINSQFTTQTLQH